MLHVIYSECRKQAHYAECHYAECHSAAIGVGCIHYNRMYKYSSLLCTFVNYGYKIWIN
jgi:hypothetical protein